MYPKVWKSVEKRIKVNFDLDMLIIYLILSIHKYYETHQKKIGKLDKNNTWQTEEDDVFSDVQVFHKFITESGYSSYHSSPSHPQ